jgi:hypothetical protein
VKEAAPAQYTPPAELAARCEGLVAELQAAVERVESAPGEGVFIKASSRSAKDAPTSQVI